MPASRRVAALFVLGLALAAGACGPRAAAPTGPPERPAAPASAAAPPTSGGDPANDEWRALERAAEAEGRVVVYGAPGKEWREFLSGPFARAYPGITVEYYGLGGAEIGSRITSEQRGGVYNADVFLTGVTTVNYTLLPAEAIVPVRDVLMLPEVLDTSLWWQGRHWYGDEEGQYDFLFAPTASKGFAYNTQVVNPNDLQSYRDVLDPRYKGKVVSWDPRQPGPSSQALRFFYHHPDLGPQFIRDFYTLTDVTVSTDGRQIADWIARERFPLGAWISTVEVDQAHDQGLPVDSLRRPLREGGYVSSSYGGIGLLKNGPHPNAAKLYVNWILSRTGQMALQDIVGQNSARMDVPKDKLRALGVAPEEGASYVFIDLPQYVLDRQAEAELRRIPREVLDSR